MGNIRSRLRKSPPKPNRYFLDRKAIDLNEITAIYVVANQLEPSAWNIMYYGLNGEYYLGQVYTDKYLVKKRLSLAQSCLNRWKIYQISLLCPDS
jgi:hypothetical protein